MRTTGANGRQSSLSPVFLAAAGSLAHVNANGPLSAAPPGRCANHDAPGKTRFQLRAVRRVAKAGNAASFFEFAPPPGGGLDRCAIGEALAIKGMGRGDGPQHPNDGR